MPMYLFEEEKKNRSVIIILTVDYSLIIEKKLEIEKKANKLVRGFKSCQES